MAPTMDFVVCEKLVADLMFIRQNLDILHLCINRTGSRTERKTNKFAKMKEYLCTLCVQAYWEHWNESAMILSVFENRLQASLV